MNDAPLRKGWTTGACAAAAARAAFVALHGGGFPDPVTIRLPGGLAPSFALARAERGDGSATAGVLKDAGDDPDVTHGALILATVAAAPAGGGVLFRAGEGVGTVTLPGLPLAVGEPAINPGPRAQIADNLAEAAAALGVAADAVVTIAIPGGTALAGRTLNARLGIRGGLSILGTTGVVRPYSCAAWVHSIHRGIDVARALGLCHLGAATGKTSEAWLRHQLGLPEQALIDMGDMAGAVLKYVRAHPVRRLTLAGGFAKLAKLAAGAMDLHSRASTVDTAFLARLLGELGGDADAAARCASAAQILALAEPLPLGDVVAARARETAMAVLAGGTEVAVVALDRAGAVVGRSGG
ncbi:cobalt-precorrin-5B (C(1))-methyltransferase [Magnetospirillum sp. UT-4]|uniref:cobalt-precorrin-5B (C(1))-methyltransferase n=1 Tax=Magnetospirillum sp. UT-4 TaxID=2681467 RepID=UPI0013855902|nr:cobalt-precorrin-5B (C(1))-methyltransferase [Magnetospirillum sp. UT-4]CAA7617251.1 putative cobalt-precorrin-6A synthase (deacetylating) [Magnetospirillum sp. UT-4]